MDQTIIDTAEALAKLIAALPLADKVMHLNAVREALHKVSPFAAEPVDFVKWIPQNFVESNDYNPNSVAPPEMELLRHSIEQDGYTQPIVSWERQEAFEVVDGFHRNRVGRECESVQKRIHGYLPLVVINHARTERNDRVAATIRHNRARGKHAVQSMSDIVIDLKRRNWTDNKIAKELGMDADEVLRLSQISGLAEMFQDHEFTEAWESADILDSDSPEIIDDQVDGG
jgi:ParB-like chromosome segregation protein Spo0J